MKLDLDSHAITIACPSCGKKFDEKIGRLKRDPKLTCPGCRTTITVNAAKLCSGIQSAQKSMDSFGRALGKLGK